MTENAVIRPMGEEDLDAVVRLMSESFSRRPPEYFRDGLTALEHRPVPDGGEKWGYVIDDGGVRGAVLSISVTHDYGDASQTYTNISTWCVAPTHRGPLAKALYDRAGGPDAWVTANLSAAKHTLPTLDKLKFRPRTTGQYVAVATRGAQGRGRMLSLADSLREGLNQHHAKTLEDHAERGCLVGCLATPDRLMPLVFLPRTIKKVFTGGQLIYCQDMQHFATHAKPVLKWLRRKGKMAMILDASDDLPQFRGVFLEGKAAKYLRGADPIWDVDHTYSEMYYLGF